MVLPVGFDPWRQGWSTPSEVPPLPKGIRESNRERDDYSDQDDKHSNESDNDASGGAGSLPTNGSARFQRWIARLSRSQHGIEKAFVQRARARRLNRAARVLTAHAHAERQYARARPPFTYEQWRIVSSAVNSAKSACESSNKANVEAIELSRAVDPIRFQ